MLISILFLMLGIRLQMEISYYAVLAVYFGLNLLKFVWKLIKDDYIPHKMDDTTADNPLQGAGE